jgi:hypothetical protein
VELPRHAPAWRHADSDLDYFFAAPNPKFHVRRATATLRRRLFTIPGRLGHTARRLHLRLPTNWPWARAFGTAVTSINALLLRSRTANALPSATRKTSETPADRQLDHAQP